MPLSERDREDLNIAVDIALDHYDEGRGWDDRTLDEVVEAVVARHVTAALTEAAEELNARMTRNIGGHPFAERDRGLREAERVVRARIVRNLAELGA